MLAVITSSFSFLSFRGLDVVGGAAIVAAVMILLPFIAFCILGVPHVCLFTNTFI